MAAVIFVQHCLSGWPARARDPAFGLVWGDRPLRARGPGQMPGRGGAGYIPPMDLRCTCRVPAVYLGR